MPRGGCPLLENCMRTYPFDHSATRPNLIRSLVDSDARYAPTDSYIYRQGRDRFFDAGSDKGCRINTQELARRTSPEVINRLLNAPHVRDALGGTPRQVMKHLGVKRLNH